MIGLFRQKINPILIAKPSEFLLKAFNLLGQEVALLVEEEKQAGEHSVLFNGENFASGVYFYRLRAIGVGKNNFLETKKLLLLR
jgi:hypothetical protein